MRVPLILVDWKIDNLTFIEYEYKNASKKKKNEDFNK